MREGSSGRSAVPIGSYTFAVGDVVASIHYSIHGTVAWIGSSGTMGVIWKDGDGSEVIYPADTDLLRKLYPWET